MRTISGDQIEVGTALPELSVELTPTMIISTALSTMDFTPVHHDVEQARAQGSKDIFLNILTTMGLVERYVTDWAGPEVLIRGINVKLGVPAYAGDTLTFTGGVASETAGEYTVQVRGRVSLGDHATGTVRFTLPGGTGCSAPGRLSPGSARPSSPSGRDVRNSSSPPRRSSGRSTTRGSRPPRSTAW
jgi:acyl dehydratase